MHLLSSKLRGSLLAVAAMAFPTFAGAQTIWDYSNGTFSAEASFTMIGSELQVVLTNTSTSPATSATDVLTGLFFDFNSGFGSGIGNPGAHDVTLTPGSVLYTSTTTTTTPSQIDAGYGFGVTTSGNSAIPAGMYEFKAVGYGEGVGQSNFAQNAGTNLDGLDYSILPNNTDFSGANASITGHFPLVMNSVTFTLDAPANTDLSQLKDVVFAYGTGPDTVPGGGNGHPRVFTPEPITMSLGIAGIALFVRRRKKA